MCPDAAHLVSQATPGAVAYRCGGCGHRQRQRAPWCPRCGEALTEVPGAGPSRLRMDALPPGFTPLAIDPGNSTEGDDASSRGTPPQDRPECLLGAVAPGGLTDEGPAVSAAGIRGARTSKPYCPRCRAPGAPLELWEGGQAELRCPGCGGSLEAGEEAPRKLSFRNDRVLCIDDDPFICQLLTLTLKAHAFVPLTAPDGPTGLALAAAERPRLVLVDIMLPGMDGFEVCRRLKADPRTAAIPLVVLTANAGPKLNIQAFQAGADLALTKPFQADRLIAILRGALALKEGGPAP